MLDSSDILPSSVKTDYYKFMIVLEKPKYNTPKNADSNRYAKLQTQHNHSIMHASLLVL
jgi:hypothetical protein